MKKRFAKYRKKNKSPLGPEPVPNDPDVYISGQGDETEQEQKPDIKDPEKQDPLKIDEPEKTEKQKIDDPKSKALNPFKK
jgi:hypothetical protein